MSPEGNAVSEAGGIMKRVFLALVTVIVTALCLIGFLWLLAQAGVTCVLCA